MVIGIDPGLTGAVALIDGDQYVAVWDMPVVEKTHGKGKIVNAYLLADILLEAKLDYIDPTGELAVAVVEQVSAMPGQGVTSMFGFGHSAGVIDGVLGALGIRHAKVLPRTWKRSAGLVGREKDASRTKAIELYPEARHMLQRKKDCGRADAILIAQWGEVHL